MNAARSFNVARTHPPVCSSLRANQPVGFSWKQPSESEFPLTAPLIRATFSREYKEGRIKMNTKQLIKPIALALFLGAFILSGTSVQAHDTRQAGASKRLSVKTPFSQFHSRQAGASKRLSVFE